MVKYTPVFVSAEMTDQGYWRVVFSVAPALRLPVTVARIGISRSEAIALVESIIPDITPAPVEAPWQHPTPKPDDRTVAVSDAETLTMSSLSP